MGLLSRHHVGSKPHRLALLTGAAALLYLAAGVALAYVAGLGEIWRAVQQRNWLWLLASVGGVTLAFVGNYFGYRGEEPALRR